MAGLVSKYSHIIWDWNGTIINDTPLSVRIVNEHTRQHLGKELSFEEYRDTFRMPVKYFYESLGYDFNKHSWDDLYKYYHKEYSSKEHLCELHDGAREILKLLNLQGKTQSILSAYPDSLLQNVLTKFNLHDLFKWKIGTPDNQESGISKIFTGKALIKESGIDPNKAVLIGDTAHDAEVAEELGIDVIIVPNGHQSHKALRKSITKFAATLHSLVK
ncbi:MAG: HAD hydrolase-like protein [bacterium]|mgnify:CR=1 FL=1|nr:HAD hydrolase-like protein [bacterium]